MNNSNTSSQHDSQSDLFDPVKTASGFDPDLAIVFLYHAVLGRPADPAGFSTYHNLLVNEGYSLHQIFLALHNSPEYALRHPDESNGRFVTRKYLLNNLILNLPINDSVYDPVTSGVTNIYEPHVCSIIKSILREGFFFLDIGANIGVHTCLGSQLVGENGLVIAVEASLANATVLKLNADESQYGNIVICPIPASKATGILKITDVRDSSNQVILRNDMTALDGVRTSRQLVIPLDLIIKSFQKIDLIKIDVEGHELEALTGLEECIKQSKPPIIAEFTHGFTNHYAFFLFQQGYVAQVIYGDGSLSSSTNTQVELDKLFVPISAGAAHCDLLFTHERKLR